jgi:hypothetical protein
MRPSTPGLSKGYSVRHLRELEQTQLTTSEAQEFYFHDNQVV